ncbi:hypothetical protein GXB85_14515 [Cellulomonas sp. APG4]|uniref:hypothetical protein n=1 Tax=Cellulomonas sp. APG4 TaxID=1538656 RepID=UPI00137A3006|nr:hypothetical protein [Cellulomonas sp. APG4]NCT92156.1 hypothetical protein [Cellulomonas sp. APG4]
MSFDLEHELARLAGTVHDDAVADRMSGQVRTMVSRIRRRRAARHTAQGAIGLGAATAVVVGGMQLGGGRLTPPAAPTPDLTRQPLECGAPLPAPPEQEWGVQTEATLREVVVTDDGAAVTGDLTFSGLPEGAELVGVPTLVVTRDGTVVGASGEVGSFAGATTFTFRQMLVSCEDGAPLPAGEYELEARQLVRGPDGEVTEVRPGPWAVQAPRMDVPDDGAEADLGEAGSGRTAEEQEALLTRNEMLSFPQENPDGLMPLCGAPAELGDGTAPLVLDPPDLDLGEAGQTATGTAVVRTRGDASVIANASGAGARLVLMKDGIVVGYQFLDAEDTTLLDLGPGEEREVPLHLTRQLCGTGEGGTGAALPLPRDTYEAVVALDVILKEVTEPGAEPDGSTRPLTVVSEPVEITIR